MRAKTEAEKVTGKVDLFQSSSSTASTSGHAETESSTVEECTRRSQITVSKKQNWAKLPSTSKDPANTDLCTSLVYGPQDWDLCSGKAEVSKQAWSQRTLSEDGLKRKQNDLELEFGYSRTPCDSIDAGLPELTPASTNFVDMCDSSSSAKISGQGAYLQHLDRSSRAWVLSTGKPQSSDEVLPARITEWRQGPGGDGNIWYNPIPEEDDSRATGGAAQEKYGDPWRRRETEESAKEKRDQKRSGGLSPTGVHQMREIQTEADIIRAESLASRSQQLCVRLEPRGLLYVKLTLLEQFVTPFPRLSDLPPPKVFGMELRHLVEKEASALKVPLIIQKCISEIERRGLKVVGLYRLCGSAAVKKELRDAFERDSAAVTLNDELYPDVNVITGILKDYLRELPSPLITRTLYEVVLEAMMVRPACRNTSDAQRSQNTVSLLQCLPEAERATLSFLLDHLSLVASYSDSNRMTCQNLAVCFGPVLLTPTQESWQAGMTAPGSGALAGSGAGRGGRSFAHSEEIASAVDFKRHIEALHYLLQLWPVPKGRVTGDSLASQSSLQVVVSRRGRGRLESPPCNRYAGDWSVCGRDFLSNDEADYDEVAGSESDDEDMEEPKKRDVWTSPDGVYVDEFALDFDAPFTCRLSLKDFDTLISDLERELAKQINICL
ncbi:rho GTPase-activating protein SYDE1-like [Sinocyclocheilus grahami]|uniref:rho GTPase-activating protein SYDE1-like n=2 Tax=Sinocyclocheilus grahami TaxID=75366 RepID=UPI0007ACD254|nr:PREDICTED: rho GTPase-activating protein SYDE1-like [Sinocyclocheilus grahami]